MTVEHPQDFKNLGVFFSCNILLLQLSAKIMHLFKKQKSISVQYYDPETFNRLTTQMYIEGYQLSGVVGGEIYAERVLITKYSKIQGSPR